MSDLKPTETNLNQPADDELSDILYHLYESGGQNAQYIREDHVRNPLTPDQAEQAIRTKYISRQEHTQAMESTDMLAYKRGFQEAEAYYKGEAETLYIRRDVLIKAMNKVDGLEKAIRHLRRELGLEGDNQ